MTLHKNVIFMIILGVFFTIGCIKKQKPDNTKKNHNAITQNQLNYDEEEEELNLQRLRLMLRTNFGLDKDYDISFVKIGNHEANKELKTYKSLDTFDKSKKDHLLTLLDDESALFYMHTFDQSAGKGLPNSIIYVPLPLSTNKEASQMGYLIFNIENPSTVYINRSDFENLIDSKQTFLLVIRSPCPSYLKFQSSSMLKNIKHYNIDYDNNYYYWTAMTKASDLTFPVVAYFKDGGIDDIHHGYSSMAKEGSFRTFLYRNEFLSVGKKYHILIDPKYVQDKFHSKDSFYRWLTLNKSDLSGIHFKDLDLSELILYKCSLNGSRLENVRLENADMRYCDVRKTDFINTDWKLARHDHFIQ